MNTNNEKVKNLSQQLSIKNSFVLAVLVVWGTMISCSPSPKESKQEQVQQQIQTLKTMVEPEIPATVPGVQENQPTEVEQTGETVMMNPPHGQPYHRCDIPVGSPLNAAPPAKTTPVINRTGTAPTLENAARLNNARSNNISAPAVANTTPPKLNPLHGQPFHRCDIAVGSPLPVN